MERSRFLGVNDMALVEEVVVPQLVPEEAAGHVDLLATHDNDLLARESLLGNYGGQTSQQVSLAINHDGRRGESGHFEGGRILEVVN